MPMTLGESVRMLRQLRKQAKDEALMKKRMVNDMPAAGGEMMGDGGMGSGSSFPMDQIQSLTQQLAQEDPQVQFAATQAFRKMLSVEQNPPIQEVIAAGVVPRFVQFLKEVARPDLQFESAWVLTNIASGTAEQTRCVVEHGALPIFVDLLRSPNDDVKEQAVWALGNIAGDSPNFRDLVLQSGGLDPITQVLRECEKISIVRNTTWALSNLCRGKPAPPLQWVAPALPTLANLIHASDVEVLTDACWAFSYLSDGQSDTINAVIQAGVCQRLIDLLQHDSPLVQTPALRAVGNIVTGDDAQTQVMLQLGALPRLLELLQHSKKSIRKEACWTISNITAGNKEQIQAVIDAGLVPPIIQLLANAEFDIRKESAWAISNATSGGITSQIKFLVQQGCIRPLCDLLTVADAKIVHVAVEGLENILKVGETDAGVSGTHNQMATYIAEAEGLTKIEQLQQHDNNDIYEKCIKILETYFGVEDEEDADLAPSMDEGGNFAFGAGGTEGQKFDFGSNNMS